MTLEEDFTFLGFDFSTQQLKGIIVNNELEIIHQTSVNYDTDLPEFRTHNGVRREGKTVTAPVFMWIKALDLLLERLRLAGADYSKVVALSGSAQQHGTVFWSSGAEEYLQTLVDLEFLHTQLAPWFSLTNSPTWMDSSTSAQCKQLEEALGGSEKLSQITGSRAYERFSAAQILKIIQTKHDTFMCTERISLISNFACSLFLGKYAALDWCDASGMNLFDIQAKTWSEECLKACGGLSEEKLGVPVPPSTVFGNISEYYVSRFGFDENCKVVAFTGDNPSSFAGMCMTENDIAVSLGTSDTVFLWLSEPKVLKDGHIFINPVKDSEYMALLCYKNGSLIRERIRNKHTAGAWSEFSKLLDSTPRGNFGYMGLYYDAVEINPPLLGEFRFDKAGSPVKKFPSPEIEIRALIEGQFIAKKAHLMEIGIEIGEATRIIATGGASRNQSILQVLSDVFNVPVYTYDNENSAVIGAAFRAKHAALSPNEKFHSAIKPTIPPTLACEPYKDAAKIYSPMVERYKEMEESLLTKT